MDIRATRVTGDGEAFSGRARVKAVSWVASAGAATITLRDGSVTGPIRCVLDGAASSNGSVSFDGDLLFNDTIYAVLVNIVGVTIFHDG